MDHKFESILTRATSASRHQPVTSALSVHIRRWRFASAAEEGWRTHRTSERGSSMVAASALLGGRESPSAGYSENSTH